MVRMGLASLLIPPAPFRHRRRDVVGGGQHQRSFHQACRRIQRDRRTRRRTSAVGDGLGELRGFGGDAARDAVAATDLEDAGNRGRSRRGAFEGVSKVEDVPGVGVVGEKAEGGDVGSQHGGLTRAVEPKGEATRGGPGGEEGEGRGGEGKRWSGKGYDEVSFSDTRRRRGRGGEGRRRGRGGGDTMGRGGGEGRRLRTRG